MITLSKDITKTRTNRQGFEKALIFFQSRLKRILEDNSVLEGVERNIFLRKQIQDIIYSKEKIVINFVDTTYSDDSRRFFGEHSLRAEAESDSARSGTQAKGGVESYSDSVNKKGFENSKMAALPDKFRIIPVELPNSIHNCIRKI